jgi:hypothetical protein
LDRQVLLGEDLSKKETLPGHLGVCSFGWCLMLIYSERKILVAGSRFVVREKYCWLMANKSN